MTPCFLYWEALDSVPIEQQVLLIGELKGHAAGQHMHWPNRCATLWSIHHVPPSAQVFKCIEDQHGNHVIQKCAWPCKAESPWKAEALI